MKQILFAIFISLLFSTAIYSQQSKVTVREKININNDWKFFRYTNNPDSLIYDERPKGFSRKDDIVADTRATITNDTKSSKDVLKAWILPSANNFIKDRTKWHQRPEGNPGKDFPFVQNNFNDTKWEQINLPHDWAINQPFYKEENAIVGGGMGRLPIQGVAWYRKKINIPATDKGKQIYLDIDGAMSYAMVWCNGYLVGGWPYGYNSFQLELTPYLQFGKENQIAIRLDNPTNSSRWYPGAGIYRNVWLTKINPVHIAQWGTTVQTKNISSSSAKINLSVQIENNSAKDKAIQIVTNVFELNNELKIVGNKVATFPSASINIKAGDKITNTVPAIINKPKLWGPMPEQKPNLYVAVTKLYANGKLIDEYKTQFGIRNIEFNTVKGIIVNGILVRIRGVNQHHDLGALGAAYNNRAAERQLEILKEMGCNAIRLSHNPPAPELLDLTDRMGFMVIDEAFDCWERGKTPLDFHLIFNDWYEADTRSFVRRDKNHPSIIEWSYGNEVGEQYTDEAGAALSKKLYDIVKDEDSTRPTTASMNYSKPDMPFSKVPDIITLNYQGEGIRDAPAYAHLRGIKTSPLYPAFHQKFPGKQIQSSETASTLSTRGTYIFPVTSGISAPSSDTTGGDSKNLFVSAYDLYTAQFGASPDKVFSAQDHNPYVAGEFVWSGWDYLGEPTPYYSARSSYSGIIDLAGFKKDRFYLYQSRWLPNLPIAHILPHWTWNDRVGKITPVHVYTSGDEAELFLNNISLGIKKKDSFEYRLRWDSVVYEPGELKVIAYKNGKQWATDVVKTAGKATALQLSADRKIIHADGEDLSFITVSVVDKDNQFVPTASSKIKFEIEGAGEIVATDNGNPADLVSFASHERNAFSGLALVIVRSKNKVAGKIKITAKAERLQSSQIIINAQ